MFGFIAEVFGEVIKSGIFSEFMVNLMLEDVVKVYFD